jgi:hypothetical protein
MKSVSERFMSCVGNAIGCSGLYHINSMHVIGKSVGYYVKLGGAVPSTQIFLSSDSHEILGQAYDSIH